MIRPLRMSLPSLRLKRVVPEQILERHPPMFFRYIIELIVQYPAPFPGTRRMKALR